jgi:hypothetical protein
MDTVDARGLDCVVRIAGGSGWLRPNASWVRRGEPLLSGLLSTSERYAFISGPNPDNPLPLFAITGFELVLELRRRKSVRYVSCGLT